MRIKTVFIRIWSLARLHRRQAGDHKTDAGYRKEYRVKIREFSEASEQMSYLVQSLKNRINGETCAVLFRTNLAMQGVAARLTGEGIPFSLKGEGEKHLRPFYRTGSSVISADRAGVCYKSGLPEGEQQTISEYFQRGFWCRSIFTGFEEIL